MADWRPKSADYRSCAQRVGTYAHCRSHCGLKLLLGITMRHTSGPDQVSMIPAADVAPHTTTKLHVLLTEVDCMIHPFQVQVVFQQS